MFHAMRRYSAPFHKKRSMQAIRSENERFLRRLKQSSLSSFPSQEDSRSRSYGYPSHHRHRHWHNSSYSSHFSEQNHTITTSVSLRVTPLYDHFTSWGILWAAGFCIAVFAALQVFQEYRPLAKQQRLAAPTNNTDNYNSSGNLTDVTGGGDPTPPTPVSRRRYQTAPSDALTSVQPLSSANMTRFMVRLFG